MKNKADFRRNFSTKVVSSLIMQQLSMTAHSNTCYQQIPTTELLVKTKKSTAATLASSKS